MNIGVTIETLCAGFRKDERRMTGNTGHAFVPTDQRIVRHGIVREDRIGLHFFPIVGRMTHLTI